MKRRPLLAFLILSIAISWALLIPLVLASHHLIKLPFETSKVVKLQAVSAVGPCLAALLVTMAVGGLPGLQDLFGRFLRWRIGVQWYLIALLVPAVLSLVTTGLHVLFGGPAPDFNNPPIRQLLSQSTDSTSPWLLIVPVFFRELIASRVIAEEIAWRGFALPRLLRQCPAVLAGALLGLMWCVWMLPMMFVKGDHSPWLALLFLLLEIIPSSILLTWIFNNARGSLIPVVLFRTSTAVAILFLASAQAHPLLAIASNWILAGLVIAVAGHKNLCRDAARAASAVADSESGLQQEPA